MSSSPLRAVHKTSDFKAETKFSAQRLSGYLLSVSKTRQRLDQHFREVLGIPTAPCLDILLALRIDNGPMNPTAIATRVGIADTIIGRYLKVMNSKGLIELDTANIRLTPQGEAEISYFIEQIFAESFELAK